MRGEGRAFLKKNKKYLRKEEPKATFQLPNSASIMREKSDFGRRRE